MKIPPSKFLERSTTEPDKNVHKHVNTQPATSEAETKPGALSGGAAARRDFASVLKDVTRNNTRDEQNGDSRDERRETSGAGDVDGQREILREEEGQAEAGAGGGGSLGARAGVASTFLSETTNPREILHIADLEKIVAAVRSRVFADGKSEVTIELKRSVLEGLRIKIGADETGRVTAEFIAATERVRAQLDARIGDLAELLRARGINLAAIKTSVGADFSEQRERQGEQRLATPAPVGAETDGSTHAQAAASVEAQDEESARSGTTYRA